MKLGHTNISPQNMKIENQCHRRSRPGGVAVISIYGYYVQSKAYIFSMLYGTGRQFSCFGVIYQCTKFHALTTKCTIGSAIRWTNNDIARRAVCKK